MKELMKSITSIEEFDELCKNDKVTVFTFSANWCPDCLFIKPFMPKLIEQYKDYEFYYVDRDEWIAIAQRMMVMGIPSFVAVQNGKEIGRFVSKMRKTEAEINAFLKGLTN